MRGVAPVSVPGHGGHGSVGLKPTPSNVLRAHGKSTGRSVLASWWFRANQLRVSRQRQRPISGHGFPLASSRGAG
jgi:hypothetical protein